MLNKNSIKRASASIQSFNHNQIAAALRLFKKAPLYFDVPRNTFPVPASEALAHGLVFLSPDGDLLEEIPANIYHVASGLYGNSAGLFNQTFYKSFSTVRDADPIELVLDQLLHYFTTYGAEAIGLDIPTYVPLQALEIPELMVNQKNAKFVVIQFVSNEAIVERLDKYLTTLTAPNTEIKEAVTALLPFATLDTNDIKSFEIQVIQHRRLNTVPRNPVSQLRFLVYITTNETLLIKNKKMRETIKRSAASNGDTAYDILAMCDPTGLASIFLRYKPIFLAFKPHNKCAPLINHLRRMADTYHKPLAEFSLQNLTSATDVVVARKVIEKASNRDLIKVLNSIRSRVGVDGHAPGVYAIRNGRTFVKEGGLTSSNNAHLRTLIGVIADTLETRLKSTIAGKVFYMPDYIDYAVPTTEKQLVGMMPYGTRIYGPLNGAFTFGVHWFNQKDHRIDIDLHMNSATQHFGWNSAYRNGSEVLYTGDQTDAPLPNGAAEAYWFQPQSDDPFVVTANLYSGIQDCEYKIFMTTKKPTVVNYNRWGAREQNKPFTYDPNDAVFPAIPMKFHGDESSATLGMFSGSTFCFYGGVLGNHIVPAANYAQFLEGLGAQLSTKVLIRDIIEACDGEIIDSVDGLTQEQLESIVSLAPEDLEADTLFNIIDGVE